MLVNFHASLLVVEKKKPLSIAVRYEVESEVVPTTIPCALVERSALGVLVMARLVVVAFVVVEFCIDTLERVDEPRPRRPFENVRVVVVALPTNGYAKAA